MNKVLIASLIIGAFVFGCKPAKPVVAAKTEPVKKQVEEVKKEDAFIPFTRELYNMLLSNRIDIKKVQFFIDQEVVLSRYADNGKVEVSDGVIKMVNGKNVEERRIPMYTPGVCELVEGDGLRISFDPKGGNTIKFQNTRAYSPENFTFSGTNWKDGGCDIDYDGIKYRATTPTAAGMSDVKLVVKKKDVDISDLKQQTIPGRKIGG